MVCDAVCLRVLARIGRADGKRSCASFPPFSGSITTAEVHVRRRSARTAMVAHPRAFGSGDHHHGLRDFEIAAEAKGIFSLARGQLATVRGDWLLGSPTCALGALPHPLSRTSSSWYRSKSDAFTSVASASCYVLLCGGYGGRMARPLARPRGPRKQRAGLPRMTLHPDNSTLRGVTPRHPGITVAWNHPLFVLLRTCSCWCWRALPAAIDILCNRSLCRPPPLLDWGRAA